MPSSVELFAGGGGMAMGLHEAGFDHRLLVEWEAKATETLRANADGVHAPWTHDAVLTADVREHVRELARDAGPLRDVGVLAGGPPCQPFSLGGEHRGHEDARNMFPPAVEYVRLLAPKTVIFENVPGLLRQGFRPYFDYILRTLAWPTVNRRKDENWWHHDARLDRARKQSSVSLSYDVHVQRINAADLGAPQARNRVFIVGVRSDMAERSAWVDVPMTHSKHVLMAAQSDGSYWAEHGLAHPNPETALAAEDRAPYLVHGEDAQRPVRWRTVRDAICDLPEPVDGRETSGVLNHIGIPGARSYPGHTGSEIDWVAKTMKAGVHGVCGGEAMIRYPDGRLRYMTVRESARMMGFPDWYRFLHARSHAMRHIGNAVVVPVARAVGEHLRKLYGL